ncbi:hypothetical protein [Petroclostridium sp. X23]|uniref:PTS sugar transporter subunit IIA n=1 Tax=Petroclostridium sp. X23 TaxID=3045146 RepID=UPI0024ADBC59|nr:hypothetical protein [Petroclostridium sp. X23]WHH60515.1 hypothetical protein QKW49_07350 [Petroclostridium sp. X23]
MDESKIPDIFILTHGTWGKMLIESAEMIIGPIKQIYAFSLMPEQSIKEYMEQIERLLKDGREGTVIIADLCGSSTFNVAIVLYKKYKVYTMSGLDISTIIAADELRKDYRGDELISNIIQRSKDNIKNINELIEKRSQ